MIVCSLSWLTVYGRAFVSAVAAVFGAAGTDKRGSSRTEIEMKGNIIYIPRRIFREREEKKKDWKGITLIEIENG